MASTNREAIVRVERLHRYSSKGVYKLAADVLVAAMQDTNYAEHCNANFLHGRLAYMSELSEYDVFIVYDDKALRPYGVAIGRGGRPWYSDDMVYFEEVVVVDPTIPNGMTKARALKKLIDALEGAAENRGCRDIVIGTSSGHRPAAYIRVLEKRGYSLLGTSLKKEIR